MRFTKSFLMLASVTLSLVAVASSAMADETGRTTIKVVTVVGNPHRPAVTIELTRQKMNLPLHELKHALDEKAISAQGPF